MLIKNFRIDNLIVTIIAILCLAYNAAQAQVKPDSAKAKSQYEIFQEKRLKDMQAFSDQQAKDLDSLRATYLRYEEERNALIESFLNNEINDKLVVEAEEAEKANPIVAEQPEDRVEVPKVMPKPVITPEKPEERKVVDVEIKANRPVFMPLEKSYPITSGFDLNRMHPVLKKNKPHNGVDFGAPKGTPVYATADGLVEIARFSNSAGNWVMINHHNGYKTIYMHLDRIVVEENKRIKRGARIGYVGSTGYSTGPHLHYEIRLKNNPIDPKSFLLYAKTLD